MSEFAALALYPLWALAVMVAATALRLGRASGRGLIALCAALAAWATALVLLKTPETEALGERVLPVGMLLAGAFVHAAADVTSAPGRRVVAASYAASAAVAILAAAAPRSLYAAHARPPAGPLFWPIAVPAAVLSAAVFLHLALSARAAHGPERRRRGALALACLFASLGGGVAVGARVLGVSDVEFAAPLLFLAIGLTAWVVLRGERGRARELVTQGLAVAVITAALSTVGLSIFFRLLPEMTPGGGRSTAWIAFVIFFAALPLDAVRTLIVEAAGRALFRRPIGVRDLAGEVERTEVRADHAERLAEIGTMASAVAHEIRNPLGVIAAQAKILERAGASDASVRALRDQVARAKRFLDDLLRYSKPRPLEIQEIDVGAALRLSAESVRQTLGDGAPAIEVLAGDPARAGLALEVDRAAFDDVAVALLHNASVAVLGKPGAAVRVRAEPSAAALEILVEDDGPGVPPAIEAALFRPFVTGRGRDAAHPGTGLGLAIAARWVERHGGTLRHERPASGGARFVARWPRRPVLS